MLIQNSWLLVVWFVMAVVQVLTYWRHYAKDILRLPRSAKRRRLVPMFITFTTALALILNFGACVTGAFFSIFFGHWIMNAMFMSLVFWVVTISYMNALRKQRNEEKLSATS